MPRLSFSSPRKVGEERAVRVGRARAHHGVASGRCAEAENSAPSGDFVGEQTSQATSHHRAQPCTDSHRGLFSSYLQLLPRGLMRIPMLLFFGESVAES